MHAWGMAWVQESVRMHKWGARRQKEQAIWNGRTKHAENDDVQLPLHIDVGIQYSSLLA
jgi:hypothetical protein